MPAPIRFANFELNSQTRELRCDARLVSVPPKVFDCLVYLIEHRDRAVGRDELIAAVWGRADVSDRNIAQTILKLRRALGDEEPYRFVRTLTAYGYQWIADVEEIEWQTTAASIDTPSTVAPPAEKEADSEKTHLEGMELAPVARSSTSVAVKRSASDRRRLIVPLSVVLLASVLFFVWLSFHEDVAHAAQTLVLVLPVKTDATDESHAWVRLGIMDVVAQRLRSRTAAVVPSETSVAIAGRTSEQGWRDLTGARWIVEPAAQLGKDNQWTLRVRLLAPPSAPVEWEAKGTDVIRLATDLADRIADRQSLPPRSSEAVPPEPVREALVRAKAASIGGRYDEALGVLANLSAADQERTDVALSMGGAEIDLGRYDDAQARLQRLVDSATKNHDNKVAARTNSELIRIFNRRGDFQTAEKMATSLLAEQTADQDSDLRSRVLRELGRTLAEQQRWDEASVYYASARLLAVGTGDLRAMAIIDQNQAGADLGRHRPEEAEHALLRAATAFESLGELPGLAHARLGLLYLYLDELEFAKATEIARLIESNLKNVRSLPERLGYMMPLADAAIQQGLYSYARQKLNEVKRDARSADLPLYEHLSEVHLANIAVAQRDPEAAQREAAPAIAWFVNHGDMQGHLATARIALSAALRSKNELAASEAILTDLRRQPENERGGDIDIQLGVETARIAAAAGHDDEAAKTFAAMWERAKRESTSAVQVDVTSAYLEFLLQHRRLDEAQPIAAFLSRWIADSYDAALWVARYTSAVGRQNEALKLFQQAHKLAGERWSNREQEEYTKLTVPIASNKTTSGHP